MKKPALFILVVSLVVSLASQATVLRDQLITDGDAIGDMGRDARVGTHLATDQNLLAISAPGRGDVLVYEHDGLNWNYTDAFRVTEVMLGTLASQPQISALTIHQGRIVVGVKNVNLDGEYANVVYVFHFDGNQWVPEATIRPDLPEVNDFFGVSVAMSGDWLAVGAARSDVQAVDGGAVYLYHLDNGQWTQQQILTGNDTGAYDEFGTAISMSGDRLLVGAPLHNYNAATTGAAYVFELSGLSYVQTRKLLGNPAAADSEFGYSVDVVGDLLVVGARKGFNDVFLRTGSAYVFSHDGMDWLYEDTLFAGGEGELFGSAVMLHQSQVFVTGYSGVFAFTGQMGTWSVTQWLQVTERPALAETTNHLVLGFPDDDEHYPNAGKVSVFEQMVDDWVFAEDLFGKPGQEGARFGMGLALDGDRLLVGVPEDLKQEPRNASARVFERSGGLWQQQASLQPMDLTPTMEIGKAVALNNDLALVRAEDDNAAGAVYVFRNVMGVWTEEQKLTASDGFNDDGFGRTVKSAGDWIFVGSETHTSDLLSRVYVFHHNGVQWTEVQILTSGVAEDGFGINMEVTASQLIVKAGFSQDPGFEVFYVYEQTIPGVWSFVGNIQEPPGLEEDEFWGTGFAVHQDLMITISSKVDAGHGGVYGYFLKFHLYQFLNGQWVFQFSDSAGYAAGSNGLSYDLATNGEQVLLSVQTQNDFSDITTKNRFFNILPDGFLPRSVFSEDGIYYSQLAYLAVTSVMDDEHAFAGIPPSVVNGYQAGAVQVFDLNPPDLIFANGLD